MSEKIYCGSGKVFGQYGSINLGICLDDIPPQYLKKANNGKTYLNLILNQKREIDQYGKSHSIEVDTYVPNQQSNQQGGNQAPQTGQGYYKPPQQQYKSSPQAVNYNGNGEQLGSNPMPQAPPPQPPQDGKGAEDEIPFNRDL